MEFDNSFQTAPSLRQQIRSHLPILLVVGGLVGVFFGLHGAAQAVLVIAGLHLLAGLALLLVHRMRPERVGP